MEKTERLYQYSAYGLGIRSSVPLPELIEQEKAAEDITIRVEKPLCDQALKDNLNSDCPYFISADKARIHFSEVGSFFIEKGRKITVFPLHNVDENLIRLPLLGAALAVLLSQRGYFMLHASATKIGGSAIAFVGNKGDGKSTMAAALCRRGNPLLADDTVALDLTNSDYPIVLPGFPMFKLYPDSVIAALECDPEKLPEIASNVVKRACKAENFSAHRVPLRAVYVLGEGTDLSIEKLSFQHSMRFLIANSYMARFSSDWVQTGNAAVNFQQCASVVNNVPVYILKRPRRLNILKSVALAVEKQHINYTQ